MVKASYSFDVMISSLIIIFMLFYSINILQIIKYDFYVMSYNSKMDKLLLASQYIIYHNSKETYKKNPNIIESVEGVEEIRKSLSLNSLNVGFAKGEGNCIVRYVFVEEVKKLYVCGD